MTLEEQIKEAAARGLCHLTLHTVWSEDKKTVYWAARATPSTGHKYISTHSRDPVEAITEVLKALPKAPKRAAPTEKITVAVTDPEVLLRELGNSEVISEPEDAPVGLHPELEDQIDNWLPRV